MELAFSKSAAKFLRKVPANVRARVWEKLDQLAADQASLTNNVTALKGTPYLRLRVGNVRAILEMEGDRLIVINIDYRGNIYD